MKNYYTLDSKCVCGHLNREHWQKRCSVFLGQTGYCECSKFQLDNLDYIETLAEERGLV